MLLRTMVYICFAVINYQTPLDVSALTDSTDELQPTLLRRMHGDNDQKNVSYIQQDIAR